MLFWLFFIWVNLLKDLLLSIINVINVILFFIGDILEKVEFK